MPHNWMHLKRSDFAHLVWGSTASFLAGTGGYAVLRKSCLTLKNSWLCCPSKVIPALTTKVGGRFYWGMRFKYKCRYLHCDLAYIASTIAPRLPDLSFLNQLTALMLWGGNCHLFEEIVQAEPLQLPSSLQTLSFRTDWNKVYQPHMPLTLPSLPNLTKLSFGCHSILQVGLNQLTIFLPYLDMHIQRLQTIPYGSQNLRVKNRMFWYKRRLIVCNKR